MINAYYEGMKKVIIVFVALTALATSFLGARAAFLGVPTGTGIGTGALNSPIGSGSSLNWSGYVATSGTYTGVGASWIIPQVSAATGAALSADATWVGIGGVASSDLIQAGTQTIIQNGTSTYEAWYETLPGNSVVVPLAVHPGDAMTVSLNETSASEWRVSIADVTTHQTFETSVSYVSALSSAEWIQEMPSDARGFVPLDNFSAVPFTNGLAVTNGNRVTIAGANAAPLTMTTGAGGVLGSPTALGTDGASFTVTRGNAATTIVAPSPTPATIRVFFHRGRGRGRWQASSAFRFFRD